MVCATGIMTNINPDIRFGNIKLLSKETEHGDHKKTFEMGHRAYYIKEFSDTSEITQYRKGQEPGKASRSIDGISVKGGKVFKLPAHRAAQGYKRQGGKGENDAHDRNHSPFPAMWRQVIINGIDSLSRAWSYYQNITEINTGPCQ